MSAEQASMTPAVARLFARTRDELVEVAHRSAAAGVRPPAWMLVVIPQRFPQPRGCQLVQLWASSRREYAPEPGILVDADVAQLDWLGSAPVAAFGG